jgi:hypothetical protein
VIKKNNLSGNQSNNAQEGFFTLEPSENRNLSTQVNLGSGDEVIIFIIVLQ